MVLAGCLISTSCQVCWYWEGETSSTVPQGNSTVLSTQYKSTLYKSTLFCTSSHQPAILLRPSGLCVSVPVCVWSMCSLQLMPTLHGGGFPQHSGLGLLSPTSPSPLPAMPGDLPTLAIEPANIPTSSPGLTAAALGNGPSSSLNTDPLHSPLHSPLHAYSTTPATGLSYPSSYHSYSFLPTSPDQVCVPCVCVCVKYSVCIIYRLLFWVDLLTCLKYFNTNQLDAFYSQYKYSLLLISTSSRCCPRKKVQKVATCSSTTYLRTL